MKVSVIVLSWNSQEYLTDCLKSLNLLKRDSFELELIVVDNHSTDESVELVKKNFPHVKLIESSSCLGFGSGYNLGISAAITNGSDYVWIISPNITVHRSAVSELVIAAQKYPLAGVMGSRIYYAAGFEKKTVHYLPKDLGRAIWYAGGLINWSKTLATHRGMDLVDNGQFEIDSDTDYVTGYSMFIRKKVFDDIGQFDPKYYWYLDDADFCQRARKAGWRLMFICQSVCWYHPQIPPQMPKASEIYFQNRNKLLFGLKYSPIDSRMLLFKDSIFMYLLGTPWEKRAVLDYYTGNLGAGSFQS